MPFSWKKKTRCNRFSQLVADHLQSPKHGGSLVVETGFPTSLIDLYVRNRGRFRSSRKQRRDDSSNPLSSSLSPSDSSVDSSNLTSVALDRRESDDIIEEDVVVDDMIGSVNEIECEIEEERTKSNRVPVETGFPTSLIDLYVRNRGRFRRSRKQRRNDSLNPLSSSSSSPLDSSVDSGNLSSVALDHRESDFIIEEVVVVDEIENEFKEERMKSNRVLVAVLKVLFVMILALATKRFTVGITVSAFVLFFLESVGKPSMRRLSSIRRGLDPKSLFESKFHEIKNIKSAKENQLLEIEEVEEVRSEKEVEEITEEVFMEARDTISRRAKMKSKMKRLVPKKLRTSKKSSMDLKSEISHEFKEEDTLEPYHSDSKQEQEKIVETARSSGQVAHNLEMGIELQQNSGYLILCLIVLVGLIGGRIVALMLALSWCLLLKMTQRRNVKFSIS